MLQCKYSGDTQLLSSSAERYLDPVLGASSQIPAYSMTGGLMVGAVLAAKDLKGLMLTYAVGGAMLATPWVINQMSGAPVSGLDTIVTEHGKGMVQDVSEGNMVTGNIADVYFPMAAATIRYGIESVRRYVKAVKRSSEELDPERR